HPPRSPHRVVGLQGRRAPDGPPGGEREEQDLTQVPDVAADLLAGPALRVSRELREERGDGGEPGHQEREVVACVAAHTAVRASIAARISPTTSTAFSLPMKMFRPWASFLRSASTCSLVISAPSTTIPSFWQWASAAA